MPNPKRQHSKHAAANAAHTTRYALQREHSCPNCQEPRLQHRGCPKWVLQGPAGCAGRTNLIRDKQLIQQAIERVMRDRTSIVEAHRFFTIQRHIVMDGRAPFPRHAVDRPMLWAAKRSPVRNQSKNETRLTGKVVLDAMSSDQAPQPEIDGALAAARDLGIRVILVGQPEKVEQELKQWRWQGDGESRHRVS